MTRWPKARERSPDSTAERRMAAIVQHEYGAAPEDVLRPGDVPLPPGEDDRVLVRVRAASVDRGTWHVMAGMPYVMRAGFGVRRPKATNPGRCFAGSVESVGARVTGFRVGDEVYGTCAGTFAEYASVRADRLTRKPANLSFEEAAAAPISGSTALQALRDHARVHPGDRVLILGASGGVGSFAVQIAKALGADVTGVCSTGKVEFVRSLGADHVVDYATGDLAASQARYDAVIDTGGNRPVSQMRRLLAPTGRLVIVGGETSGRWLGIGRQLRAHLLSPWVKQTLGTFIASEDATHLAALRDLIESGSVVPSVDRTYPLSDTALAIRHLLDGRARGKVVVTVPAGR